MNGMNGGCVLQSCWQQYFLQEDRRHYFLFLFFLALEIVSYQIPTGASEQNRWCSNLSRQGRSYWARMIILGKTWKVFYGPFSSNTICITDILGLSIS
jgi:hypothetical protein